MDIAKSKRKLERHKARRDMLLKEHNGNEMNFTYWGGYELGYVKGKISLLEGLIDDLEELQNEK
jgi:hypothetical protein